MYQEQRLEQILKLLDEKGSLSAKEMVKHFNVSKDTIRRDFAILAREKRAQRTHGGLLPINRQPILGFQGRTEQYPESKQKMALLANELISNGDFLFLDVSTTMLVLSKQVDKKVTVFSHSLDNALILGGKEKIEFHILGGKFHQKNRFYYSLEETKALEKIHLDLAFFGAASIENGLVCYEDQEDVLVKKRAFKSSQIRILLAESSKINRHSHFVLGKLTDFDYWITDKKPDMELEKQLEGNTIILYPKGGCNNEH